VGATLFVVDSGPGIAIEHLDRIFDPFWTTKSPGEGTGLGLSLVHSIVTEHGGRIRVDSEPGNGAAFQVELPRMVDAQMPGGPTDAQGMAAAKPLRILVVDDEEPIRRTLHRYLKRRGHTVDGAGDGAEALRIIHAQAAPSYDVVLSDLRMPGMSGDQLYTELRRRDVSWEERLVFMTGDVGSADAARVLAAAGVPVILKPFDLGDVAATLEATAGKPSEAT
jgi:CheY-like chemotaxis protein